MPQRERTKHKGIYKIGEMYYVAFRDGTVQTSKNGIPYYVKRQKRIGPRLSDALKFKVEMEARVKGNKYERARVQEEMTFNELIDVYLNDGDGKKYITQFIPSYLKYFGSRKLSQITRKDLFGFKDWVKTTPKQRGGAEVTDTTVNRALAGLRRLFHFALAEEYLEESPFPRWPKSGLFHPEQRGLRNFFTEKQVEEIIDASPDWLRPMVIGACYTGLRLGELLALRWDWIDLEEGLIYLPYSKTMKDRTGRGQKVVLQRAVTDLLKSLSTRSEYVFTQSNGQPFKRWHLENAFQRVLMSLGIDTKRYSWKELRHTTATLMKLKGAEISSIKDQLRHTSIRTTEKFYIGSDTDFQRAQIELLSFRGDKVVKSGNLERKENLPSA